MVVLHFITVLCRWCETCHKSASALEKARCGTPGCKQLVENCCYEFRKELWAHYITMHNAYQKKNTELFDLHVISSTATSYIEVKTLLCGSPAVLIQKISFRKWWSFIFKQAIFLPQILKLQVSHTLSSLKCILWNPRWSFTWASGVSCKVRISVALFKFRKTSANLQCTDGCHFKV